MVRAVDNTGATQPDRVKWNMKGYLNNGWHKVELDCAESSRSLGHRGEAGVCRAVDHFAEAVEREP